MNKKAAIALSVNFLVVIIVAIAVLAMSMYLFSDVLVKVQKVDVQLQKQYEEQIWRLLDTGELVVAPINIQKITRGEMAVFGVGVRNIMVDEPIEEFTINVTNRTVGECQAIKTWLNIPRQVNRSIKKHEQDIFTVGIQTPKNIIPCTYVYDVQVYLGDQEKYGQLQKLYVVVG